MQPVAPKIGTTIRLPERDDVTFEIPHSFRNGCDKRKCLNVSPNDKHPITFTNSTLWEPAH